MKIIVPMAGMGKRMRPHTLITPKPVLPIAGKPIVQRLVEDIAKVSNESIDEISFIIGENFGPEIENKLLEIAKEMGAKGTICYQRKALGTAHAILCAEDALEGKVVVAFADTLFKADFVMDTEQDGIIWTKQVDNPEAFGVVKFNDNGIVEAFVEKPEEFVSDRAIIGIYYFKDGANLRKELQYLIDNDVRIKGGEFGLTDALENMNNKGVEFKIETVAAWLDCGNKDATVRSNKMVLEFNKDQNWVSSSLKQENTVIIPPCYIGEGVNISNSIIGPHVSIGDGCKISNSIIDNSLIRERTSLNHVFYTNSMIGTDVKIDIKKKEVSIGDYTTLI